MPEDKNLQSDGGWENYHNLVMSELDRHNVSLSILDTKLDKLQETLTEKLDHIRITDIPGLRTDVVALKIKTSRTAGWIGGLSGLMGGLSPIIVALLYKIFSH